MTPTERRLAVTRRRRLAHIGVGGVLAITATAVAHRHPTSASATDPAVVAESGVVAVPAHHRIDIDRVSRSQPRRPLVAAQRVVHRVVVSAPPAASGSLPWPWPELAGCESSGHWSEVTNNGFLWGLQFVASTWDAYRGDLPRAETYLARRLAPTPPEQISVAERVQHAQGWGAWPACSRKVGLR